MPEILSALAGLIREQLELAPDRVVIYNQGQKIAPTDGLFIELSFVAGRPFGVAKHYEDNPDKTQLVEVQEQVTQETYTIMVMSQNEEARLRKHEIIFALCGDACQQLMEQYSFKIGFLPTTFVDVSESEGASRLNRYAFTFSALLVHRRERVVQSYNTLQTGNPSITVNP